MELIDNLNLMDSFWRVRSLEIVFAFHWGFTNLSGH